MYRKVMLLFALLVALLMGMRSLAWATEDVRAPAAAVAAGPNSDYRLGVADQIQVNVYGEPTLSGSFPVNADGTVALPLVGNVQAAGKSAVELQETIRAALGDGYLKDPRVSVSVLTFRPFYILGEVNKPGEYPYATGLTVHKAVAIAGGFTYRADERRVYIKRSKDIEESRVPLTSDLMVQPGDTIRVSERYF
jgi:polysaccharide export outer membrane protein